MLYSSVTFLFYFFPLFLVAYYLVPRTWAKNLVLFAASLVFYIFGAGQLVVLLFAIGIIAWVFSWLIAKTQLKKTFIFLAVIVYIGILIYYKYLGFITENLIYAGVKGLPDIKSVMPAGVSFFIFQALSYNIDVYRKNSRFEKNPSYVILYICMFPQLMSGPLVRYHSIEPQLKSRTFDFNMFSDGIKRFIIGLAKKVLIANPIGLLVNQIMNTELHYLSPLTAWIGIIAFTLQLYFDFSGYTDMAIGVGKMLGFNLPENFNFPYISRSISEFWRRWHMTLSAWLRDYVFMPLSLSLRRWKNLGVFVSLLLTFTLCGIWHNPGWNFLIWGAIHGIFLGLEPLFFNKFLAKLKGWATIYTLFIITTSFVFIRTANIHQAFDYLRVMFTTADSTALSAAAFLSKQHIILIILAIFFSLPLKQFFVLKTKKMAHIFNAFSIVFLLAIFLLSAMAITSETYTPFLYFKF